MKKNNFRSGYILFFGLVPIIDTINGMLIQIIKINSQLGTIYRLIAYCMCIICFFNKNIISEVYKLVLIVTYFLSITLITSFNNRSALSYNILITIKLIFPIIIIMSFKNLNKNSILSKSDIVKVINIYSIVFPLTMLITKLLGIGLHTYNNGSGFKGFYKSNNELNIIFVMLFIFCFDNFINANESKNKNKYFLLSVLNMISLISISSKTSLLVALVILIKYFIRSFRKFNVKNGVLILMVTVISVILLKRYYYNVIMLSIQRQQYFYNLYGDRKLSFLFSGRNELLIYAFNGLKRDQYIILNTFFGFGPYKICSIIGYNVDLNTRIIEMDLFDTFFWFGFVGLALIVRFYFNIYKQAKIKYRKRQLEYCYLLIFIITVLFSVFAGHVLYGAMASTVFSMFLCIIIADDNCEKFYFECEEH